MNYRLSFNRRMKQRKNAWTSDRAISRTIKTRRWSRSFRFRVIQSHSTSLMEYVREGEVTIRMIKKKKNGLDDADEVNDGQTLQDWVRERRRVSVVPTRLTPRATHSNGRPPTIHQYARLVFPAPSCSTRRSESPLNGQHVRENLACSVFHLCLLTERKKRGEANASEEDYGVDCSDLTPACVDMQGMTRRWTRTRERRKMNERCQEDSFSFDRWGWTKSKWRDWLIPARSLSLTFTLCIQVLEQQITRCLSLSWWMWSDDNL